MIDMIIQRKASQSYSFLPNPLPNRRLLIVFTPPPAPLRTADCRYRRLDGQYSLPPRPRDISTVVRPKVDRYRWMGRIWQRWSRPESFCAYFSFYLLPCRALDSIDPSSRTTKVISKPLISRAKIDLAQLFIVSAHCLWVYDYLLTLGDEVRYPPIFDRMSRSDRPVDKVRLAWEEKFGRVHPYLV